MTEKTITDFTDAQTEADRSWRSVDDDVMGGVSEGGFSVTAENTGIFSGETSLENNGGFSSVRRAVDNSDFANAEAVKLRVKGDGRQYQCNSSITAGSQQDYFRYRTILLAKQSTPQSLTA